MPDIIDKLIQGDYPEDTPHLISRVEDKIQEERGMRRARIHFKNGLQLSVIQGDFSYGAGDGLYEVAAFDLDGEMYGELLGEYQQDDDVLGYLTEEEVIFFIERIGNLIQEKTL